MIAELSLSVLYVRIGEIIVSNILQLEDLYVDDDDEDNYGDDGDDDDDGDIDDDGDDDDDCYYLKMDLLRIG